MKLLTITIPCYNSQDYMEKSICSALTGGDRVEIIIVDDGSSDNTLQIAKKYEEKFPNIVRVIHQENGGHGEAVNTGIKNATGLYFKVVDSDDCLGRKALEKVLNLLEEMVAKDAGLDMLVSNFMYDKQGARHKKIMRYRSAMTPGKMLGWEDIHFGRTQYLLMHSVIYRTKILRECGMELPKHTFYVDNIYVYKGVRILGLGGSMEYIPGASNQYTEWRMRARIRKLWWKLWWHKGFDILVTHAPAYKLNDMEDLPHRGFKAFLKLMDKYHPKYFLHGHVHANYGKGFKRKDVYGTTRVINGYEFYVIEYPGEPVVSAEKKENTST